MRHKKDELSHVGDDNHPGMIDVSGKDTTLREATARSLVALPDAVMALLDDGEIQSKKGPVFQTAIIAGTMAVKRTADLIPFCHPLQVERCDVKIRINDSREVEIDCTVSVHARTGVEMEALVGASAAALTVYDMCKSVSHEIRIRETGLLHKSGGKRDVDLSSL